MVIANARQPNPDGEHWHQSGIGPESSSFPQEQESSPLNSIMDDSAVDGISQRYEGFLLRILDAQLVDKGANSWVTAILYRLSSVVVLR